MVHCTIYKDPELLAQFNELNSTAEYASSSDTANEDLKPAPSNISVAITSPYSNDAQSGSHKTSKEQRSNDSQISVEEAKRLALKFKREGNTDEALKWIRYAKKMENGNNAYTTKEAPTPTSVVATNKPADVSSYSKSTGNQKQGQPIDRKAAAGVITPSTSNLFVLLPLCVGDFIHY